MTCQPSLLLESNRPLAYLYVLTPWSFCSDPSMVFQSLVHMCTCLFLEDTTKVVRPCVSVQFKEALPAKNGSSRQEDLS